MMRTATTERIRSDQREAEWLVQLLADIQKDVAKQPKILTVERIRARLQAAMDHRPVRAAA